MTDAGTDLDEKPRRDPLGLIVGGAVAAVGLVVALVVRDRRRKERERLEALAAAAAAAAARRRLGRGSVDVHRSSNASPRPLAAGSVPAIG